MTLPPPPSSGTGSHAFGWARELAAAAGFVFASGAGSAAAQIERPGLGWDVGIYIGYHFGGGAPRRISFGVEGRGLYGNLIPSCGDSAVHPFGAVVGRVGFVGRELRLVTGAQGGIRGGYVGGGGELGVGFDLAESGGFFVQPGLEVSGVQVFTLRAHHAFERDTAISLGIRGGTGSFPGCVSAGRPLRDCHGLAPPGSVLIAAGEGRRGAQLWGERAAAEWASVPAFEQLAQQLSACGAPATLVRRALEAAADEAHHTLMSAAVAARLAGGPVWLAPPTAAPRPPIAGEPGLVRLAHESWVDGCLAEGTAAAEAAAEAAATGDRAIASTQTIIARDEARHAELAWDVLAWSAAVSPERTRAALTTCPPVIGAVAPRVHAEARARLASLL